MPHPIPTAKNLQRETLRKIQGSSKFSQKQKQLAMLKVAYGEDNDLLTKYINNLVAVSRIYPRHLPTQASGRWSTLDPPVTNWPRACIEPSCQAWLKETIYGLDHLGYIDHEWSDTCWSIRDILLPDDDEILVSWDHDNIEGKIHDIIVNHKRNIIAHKELYDLHTITYCNIFGKAYPQDLRNPHGSEVDTEWRKINNWQGKDTKVRVLSKNFNHGSKYTESYMFVHKIKGIEQFGVSYERLEELAKAYIAANQESWDAKLKIMADIRQKRIARSLYGFRRMFFTSDSETGREGFSHMISATVSDYNNQTIQLVDGWIGDSCTLLHNAHDGDKFAVKKDWLDREYDGDIASFKTDIAGLIERDVVYQERSLIMTAGIKVHV